MKEPDAHDRGEDSAHQCVMRELVQTFRDEPSLEAVILQHDNNRPEIATIGPPLSKAVEQQTADAIQAARQRGEEHGCGLLSGENTCATCPLPITQDQRTGIEIKHTGRATRVSRVTCETAPKFWHWKKLPMPRLTQRELQLPELKTEAGEDGSLRETGAPEESEWKWQLAAAGACGVLALSAFLVQGAAYSVALYAAAYLAGSWFTVQETWELLKKGRLDVHFLMLAVAAGSASIGAWGEGAMLLFLFSLSGGLEHFAMGRTQREIRSLFKNAPRTAVIRNAEGLEEEIPVERIRAGHHLLIRPDRQFPVDAEITQGRSEADESTLTGESTPVEKQPGDTVYSGTLNLWGSLEAKALRPASESSLQKVIRLIQQAQKLKAPSQQFTDRFGGTYTIVVLALSGIMFLVWWLGTGLPAFVPQAGETSAFYRAMILLVVASPCALVLSIPSAILAAIAWSARRGILFRGGAAVENLGEAEMVALDKTGTLTTGNLSVQDVASWPPGQEDRIERLAFSMERFSAHPLARAITHHGKRKQLEALPMEEIESLPGLGIRARHSGETCVLGKRLFIRQNLSPALREKLESLDVPKESTPGLAEVWIATGSLLGRITLRDEIRPEASGIIQQLKSQGLTTLLLTGDHPASAAALASQVQLDEVRAGLSPDEKLRIIQGHTNRGRKIVMVGDGVNDAPALAAAHVGVAMGARGSDAALEQAEVVLMHDRLESFLSAFELSRRARRIIRQNLFVSLGTVLVLVGFALAGQIPLTVGVLGHEGSTVVVVMNSLRLLLMRESSATTDPVGHRCRDAATHPNCTRRND